MTKYILNMFSTLPIIFLADSEAPAKSTLQSPPSLPSPPRSYEGLVRLAGYIIQSSRFSRPHGKNTTTLS